MKGRAIKEKEIIALRVVHIVVLARQLMLSACYLGVLYCNRGSLLYHLNQLMQVYKNIITYSSP